MELSKVFDHFLWICYSFGAFEALKQRSVDERGNLSPQARVLCGLGAGVCEAIFAVTPMETVKVKFINDQRSGNPRFKGFFHGVGLILKEQGNFCLQFKVVCVKLKQNIIFF